MRRRVWITAGVIAVLLLFLAAGLVGGAYFYITKKRMQLLTEGNAAFSEGRWRDAKNYYSWYLVNYPDDMDTLSKFAEANAHMLADRRAALRAAGNAFFQIAMRNPEDAERQQQVLEFHKRYGLWGELEYTAGYFLKKKPNDPELIYYRALGLDRQGRAKDAIPLYRSLTDAGTDRLDVYGNLARLLRDQDLTAQAEAVLDAMTEKHGDNGKAHLERAKYYLGANALEDSETEIAAALEMSPGDPEVLATAAQLAVIQRDWEKAESYASKALAADRGNANARLIAVYAKERAGRREEAITLVKELSHVELTDNIDLLMTLAELEISDGQLDEARKTVEHVRTAYPGDYVLTEYLNARILLAEGKAAEAADKLTAVYESNPAFSRAQLYRGLAYLEAGDAAKAHTVFAAYIADNPGDDQARALMRAASGLPGDINEIEAEARALLSDPNASAAALRNMARSVLQADRRPIGQLAGDSVAVTLLERAIEREPGNAGPYQDLAALMIAAGKLEDAASLVEKAAAAGVPRAELAIYEAEGALAAGDPDKAYTLYNTTIEGGPLKSEDAYAWASLFARRGFLAQGLQALVLAEEKAADEAVKSDLKVVQAELVTRYGDLSRAFDMLAELTQEIPSGTPSWRRLQEEKLMLAETLLRQQKPEDRARVETLLGEVEQAEPDNDTARLLRADLCLTEQPPDVEKAEQLAAAVLESSPSDLHALHVLTRVSLARGDGLGALTDLQMAALNTSGELSSQMLVAEGLLQDRRYREARDTLTAVLSQQPEQPRALELLVRTYAALGQPDQAEAALAQLEPLLADNAEGSKLRTSLRALIAINRQQWSTAEEMLRGQISEHGEDFKAVQTLAHAVLRQGRFTEAEKLLEDFCERIADDAEAWTTLGEFYLEEGGEDHLADAMSAFRQAELVKEGFSPALRGMVSVQLRSGNPGAALRLCDRYLERQPGDADMLYRKATLLARDANRPEEALDVIEQAMNISARPEFVLVRGQLRLALGKYQDALLDFQRFADTQGGSTADLDLSMAEAYAGLGEYALAQQYCESAQRKASGGQEMDSARLKRVRTQIEEGAGND
jgi:predicted Zn-dependent protease